MRTLHTIALSVAVTASFVTLSAAPLVHADTNTTATTVCTVKAVGTKNTAGNSDSRFTLNSDGTVTGAFTVTGTDCNEAITLAVWQAPDADKGRPYSEQTLFGHTTGTFAAGTHTLSVKLPTCFYQVDLVKGTSPTDSKGGPEYTKGTILGSLHGGTQACTPITPPNPPTPPTPPTPPVTPPVLPNTGTGSNIFVLSAVVAVAGYVGSVIRNKMRVSKVNV
ncbi:MAG TPA: LPXTG cell wall anchor domain-containing protein [Patescibacteria group bacterium]|nr:LPXTG cell wall anchor domain-containing protein [Patescibacteria group bacterium]